MTANTGATASGESVGNGATLSKQELREQTLGLGQTLKHIADNDPVGTPSAQAIAVFAEWLAITGNTCPRADLFEDVAENFDPAANSNRDLFLLFDMLVNYLDIDEDPAPQGAFIGLPMLGA